MSGVYTCKVSDKATDKSALFAFEIKYCICGHPKSIWKEHSLFRRFFGGFYVA